MAVQMNNANASTVPSTPSTKLASIATPPGQRAISGVHARPCNRPYKATTPMNAGSTITSRDSHDVRHFAAVRHARSGRPRWKNDAIRPPPRNTSATRLPCA